MLAGWRNSTKGSACETPRAARRVRGPAGAGPRHHRVLFRSGVNVVGNQEFVDRTAGRFFMRTEFDGLVDESAIAPELKAILPAGAVMRLSRLAPKRVVVLASKEHHCLADLPRPARLSRAQCPGARGGEQSRGVGVIGPEVRPSVSSPSHADLSLAKSTRPRCSRRCSSTVRTMWSSPSTCGCSVRGSWVNSPRDW